MNIARSSFDAMLSGSHFDFAIHECLGIGLVVILPYLADKEALGDMVAAMEAVNDATGYARQLQMRQGKSFWAVSYDSETDMIKIHY